MYNMPIISRQEAFTPGGENGTNMNQSIFTIKINVRLARDVYRMELAGDNSAVTTPGQFVNIRLDGRFLRRPISVCDKTADGMVLIYKTVGHGTEQLAGMEPGQQLDILTGLGNGYDLTKSGDRPLLIGGGVGVPPMYWLCRELIAQGKDVTVILGFNTEEEIFYQKEFSDLGARVIVTTVDGSFGTKGFVTDGMKLLEDETAFANASATGCESSIPAAERCKAPATQDTAAEASTADSREAPATQVNAANAPAYTYIYTCGPMPMFRAINQAAKTSGQFSFEERMGCGFGACMGCSCKTITGYKRICKDGPVLEREEIIW